MAAREAYVLSPVKPVKYSLTSGTNIPAPEDTPPSSPSNRPPTPGGGPLSSHPTILLEREFAVPGAFPPTPEAEMEHQSKLSTSTSGTVGNRDRAESYVTTPASPASTYQMPMHASPPSMRRPSGVRRIFSMTNLRQSFNSSRTSLSLRPGSSYQDVAPSEPSNFTTATPSTMEPPSLHSSRPTNTLRKKRSSSWFKRKSGFFAMDSDGTLGMVSEDTREPKRWKETLPVLPEISTLVGEDAGSIGWDEQAFKR